MTAPLRIATNFEDLPDEARDIMADDREAWDDRQERAERGARQHGMKVKWYDGIFSVKLED